MKHIILFSCAMLLGGCAAPSENGARFDPPFAITTSDLKQAEWVKDVVSRTPGIGSKYRVQPGSDSITVTFGINLPKEQEETVK